MAIYQRPSLPKDATVNDLAPVGKSGIELTPKTRVLIINRGSHDYVDMYDARKYRVPPGVSEVEYEVAEHFRLRSVIPGSRDPVLGKQEHFIAILGIDPEHRCAPLDAVEQSKADAAPEAIDRTSMDGADAEVKVVATSAARSRVAGGNRRVQQKTETNDGKALAPEALEPTRGGDAMRQIARDAADAEAAGA